MNKDDLLKSESVVERLNNDYPALARLGETIRALPILLQTQKESRMQTFEEWAEQYSLDEDYPTRTGRRYDCKAAWDAALATANKRIMELEEDLRSKEDALIMAQNAAEKRGAKLTAEREVSDKLVAALKYAQQIIGHPDDIGSKYIADIIAEVATIRAK